MRHLCNVLHIDQRRSRHLESLQSIGISACGIDFLEIALTELRCIIAAAVVPDRAARRRCNRHLSVTLMSAGDATGHLPEAASL